MTDPNAKRPRSFQCRDVLWEAVEQMAGELECSVDYLLNEALKQYVRQRGHRLPAVMRLRDEPAGPSPVPAHLAHTPHMPPAASAAASMQASPTAVPPPMPRPTQQSLGATPMPPPMMRQPTPPPVAPAPPTLGPPRPTLGMEGMVKPPNVPPMAAPPFASPAPPPVRPVDRPTATNVQMPGAPPPAPPGFSAPARYPSMMGAQPGAPMAPPPSSVAGSPYASPPGGAPLPPPPVPQLQREQPPSQMPAPGSAPPGPGGAAVPTPPLYVLYGGARQQVDKDRFIIGRGKQAVDLTIKDPNISRQHAMVEYTSGQYFIVDLGSTNGIEHNGQRITRKVITEGDLIRICDHEVRFTYR